jgi:ADP-heptose:LPS heptosyltransferase
MRLLRKLPMTEFDKILSISELPENMRSLRKLAMTCDLDRSGVKNGRLRRPFFTHTLNESTVPERSRRAVPDRTLNLSFPHYAQKYWVNSANDEFIYF